MGLENKIGLDDGHALKETAYREEGMMAENRFWSYEETDQTGKTIATYEYWECVSSEPPFRNSLGYRKFDMQGKQIEEVNF